MIAIIDYGLGNIRAFANIFKNLGLPYFIASKPEQLDSATKIVLPGVGAFDRAMTLLNRSGMREPLSSLVLQRHVPLLGVCVGMQMLARSSEEGTLPGLGWIDGRVRRLRPPDADRLLLLPHMGWNTISARSDDALLQGIAEGSRFYFLHSYFFECGDSRDSIAQTEYGEAFCAAVKAGNLYGVQFHPEKSHGSGIQLLRNFGALS